MIGIDEQTTCKVFHGNAEIAHFQANLINPPMHGEQHRMTENNEGDQQVPKTKRKRERERKNEAHDESTLEQRKASNQRREPQT
jgi:hypothetical protein